MLILCLSYIIISVLNKFSHLSGINKDHHEKEKLSTEDLILRAESPVGGMVEEISSFFAFLSYLILFLSLVVGPGGITLGILWAFGVV